MKVNPEDLNRLDFDKGQGLLPAIVQDVDTGRVLMLGYMSQESVLKTMKTGLVTFFSRSKKRLWTKGESSGNHISFVAMLTDCDMDALLIKGRPVGPVCHLGAETCFDEQANTLTFLKILEGVIQERYSSPSEESYTSKLFARGIDKVAQKVGEEAVELVIEAKNNNAELFKNEAADLIYHFLVLLRAKGVSLESVVQVLKQRHTT
ncbi:MAG: bifunctional phosphoribosyl-AMP cyclohydrolase/phosphoribosyl-ATP diphosphatase HisIE [Saprospiraceae bacterium]|nr:bifunctional phosphoribosyl-AMP cyclohydrolase/phosphoribosyl-ATP diphosphatase HisIE [Saprospiraceae bacterium]